MKKRYLIIDGYNLLFKMKEYNKIKSSSFPTERDTLISILKEYSSGNKYIVYCVFDAYRASSKEYIKDDEGLFIVYTKTGEKADSWIERKTKELYINHFIDVVVVSDDHAERDTALGYGAILRDCHRFIKDLYERKTNISKYVKTHNEKKVKKSSSRMSEETKEKLRKFMLKGEKF